LKGTIAPTIINYASEPARLGPVAGVNPIVRAMIKPRPGETCGLRQVISMPGKFNETASFSPSLLKFIKV